ncbi:hypothetical protein [Vallitalea maricola]|uniref:Uncharacterized protein n=1 Tax=Vallitalea maricola TaxID=3074433 RepID=A0ACB5UNZ5_9FIRM|nr:hypothetical protein AN2V17_34280 [Vallitalea sp. AN17-2]
MKKQFLMLFLVIGMILTLSPNINAKSTVKVGNQTKIYATEADEVQYYAYQSNCEIIAKISGIGGKDCEIIIKYYSKDNTYLKTSRYYKEIMNEFKISDKIPYKAGYALVEFYLNELSVGQKWLNLE